MYGLIKFIPLFPILGFLFLGIFGKKIKSESVLGWFGSMMVGISFVISVIIFFGLVGEMPEEPHIEKVFTWITAGDFSVNLSYQVDQLSILFSLIITGVGFLIHVYSIGYMHGDRSFYRFFAYLNLFIFMMLNLVLSSNFLVTFLGWEGVGLSSYLLIGFWYDRKFPGVNIKWTGDAANKAFIVNRIGDFGFLIAMFLLFTNFSTLEYVEIGEIASTNASMFYNGALITTITLLMFLGATGKSAQIPLAVWLPDAMAGPTSVSALIHAATMVTAGVFLIARNAVLFALSPDTMAVVAVVGLATAFLAATIGIVQNDIKKVLAYSTVSQLGFMFVALGVGAFTAGVFHVMTHAFFKGLLFLAAGSVIHGMHEEQNIKKMGGLSKHMPITYKTFFVGTLAISGIPFFSGFFSKDEILWYTYSQGNWALWLILAIAAVFTAFYMFRLLNLTFKGKERFDPHHVHPHESPKTMTFALITLAVLSAIGGFVNVPYALGFWASDHPSMLHSFLEPIFANANEVLGLAEAHSLHADEYLLMVLATGLAFLAWFTANKWYKDPSWKTPRAIANSLKFPYKTLLNKYYLDEFYYRVFVNPIHRISDKFLWKIFDVNVIDGIVNGSGKVTTNIGEQLRKIQSGIAQNYATLMMAGIIVILSWLIFF